MAPITLLQVLSVLSCAAGEPHRAAAGQRAVCCGPVSTGQQVMLLLSYKVNSLLGLMGGGFDHSARSIE